MAKKKLTRKQLRDLEEARANLAKLQASWDNLPKFARTRVVTAKVEGTIPKLTNPPGRDRQVIPSKVTPGGSASTKPTMVYTGTLIQGIATMHKSNAVPVLNQEDAIAVATMRRN